MTSIVVKANEPATGPAIWSTCAIWAWSRVMPRCAWRILLYAEVVARRPPATWAATPRKPAT